MLLEGRSNASDTTNTRASAAHFVELRAIPQRRQCLFDEACTKQERGWPSGLDQFFLQFCDGVISLSDNGIIGSILGTLLFARTASDLDWLSLEWTQPQVFCDVGIGQ